MATAKKTDWKIRIVGHGVKKASEFKFHPGNYRTHSKEQHKAMRASLDDLGWIDEVIENVTTGNLIDGHERVEDAIWKGDVDVPFKLIEITEEEEAQALLSIDPIAAMAGTDVVKMEDLMNQVESDNEDVMQYMDDLAERHDINIAADGTLDYLATKLDEEYLEIRQKKMLRILISVPIKNVLDAQKAIDKLEKVQGIEIDYGAN